MLKFVVVLAGLTCILAAPKPEKSDQALAEEGFAQMNQSGVDVNGEKRTVQLEKAESGAPDEADTDGNSEDREASVFRPRMETDSPETQDVLKEQDDISFVFLHDGADSENKQVNSEDFPELTYKIVPGDSKKENQENTEKEPFSTSDHSNEPPEEKKGIVDDSSSPDSNESPESREGHVAVVVDSVSITPDSKESPEGGKDNVSVVKSSVSSSPDSNESPESDEDNVSVVKSSVSSSPDSNESPESDEDNVSVVKDKVSDSQQDKSPEHEASHATDTDNGVSRRDGSNESDSVRKEEPDRSESREPFFIPWGISESEESLESDEDSDSYNSLEDSELRRKPKLTHVIDLSDALVNPKLSSTHDSENEEPPVPVEKPRLWKIARLPPKLSSRTTGPFDEFDRFFSSLLDTLMDFGQSFLKDFYSDMLFQDVISHPPRRSKSHDASVAMIRNSPGTIQITKQTSSILIPTKDVNNFNMPRLFSPMLRKHFIRM